MEENKTAYGTIEEYILLYPPEVQEKLQAIRKIIKESAPEAKEKISWQMPTFDLFGNLVHFAVHKNHIGFYPGASGIEEFKEKLSNYKSSKGAVQFPIDKQPPIELIGEIVRFRAAENIKEAELKKQKKSKK
ncbi:MAG: DUF1801 domain-containing protein [Sedimentibacter sp.]|uniref:iron chaperone n=1 Tax=Sedimentibacter sp. TaxID=1960295 RepID=UPI00315854B9